MTVLLVNDDGYRADGIKAMEKALFDAGHTVWVSAPEVQMSGMSHAMTVSGTVDIVKDGECHYHVTGTPVDCVLYSKRYEEGLFPYDPDLVISGINNGYNLATDIMYSGTCGAAREAVFCGWKAIAVSAEKLDFSIAAKFVAENLDSLYSSLDLDGFININFPPSFNGKARLTIPGEVRYADAVKLVEKDGNRLRVKISDVVRTDLAVDGFLNDIECVKEGYASVSTVSVRSYSHNPVFEKLKKVFD